MEDWMESSLEEKVDMENLELLTFDPKYKWGSDIYTANNLQNRRGTFVKFMKVKILLRSQKMKKKVQKVAFLQMRMKNVKFVD